MMWKMPPQVVRLALVTIAIVVSYFTARHFLVPESYGQLGWYRANALKDLSALPINYAGQKTCADCHDDVFKKREKARHRSVACESCHGPNQAHADDQAVKPAKIGADGRFCVRCHEASPSRPAKFPQVVLATHNAGEKCTDCHQPHLPTEAP